MTRAVSFGIIDGRPVFMDDRDDCYFHLKGELETSFLNVIANGTAVSRLTPEMRDALGLESESGSVALTRCKVARKSLVVEHGGRDPARLGDTLSIAGVMYRTRRHLATQPIEVTLARLVDMNNQAVGRAPDGQLARRAIRFLAARPLVPIKANCLLDSLALLRWLGSDARSAMLVFGVKLDPFSAHCWVQADDLLLNDRVDNVERFGPVRVVACSAVTR